MTDEPVPSLIAGLLQETLERTQLSPAVMAEEIGLDPERFMALLKTDGEPIADAEYAKLAVTLNRFCRTTWTPETLKQMQQQWHTQKDQGAGANEPNEDSETEATDNESSNDAKNSNDDKDEENGTHPQTGQIDPDDT